MHSGVPWPSVWAAAPPGLAGAAAPGATLPSPGPPPGVNASLIEAVVGSMNLLQTLANLHTLNTLQVLNTLPTTWALNSLAQVYLGNPAPPGIAGAAAVQTPWASLAAAPDPHPAAPTFTPAGADAAPPGTPAPLIRKLPFGEFVQPPANGRFSSDQPQPKNRHYQTGTIKYFYAGP